MRFAYQNVVQDGYGRAVSGATVTVTLAGGATAATIYTVFTGGTADADGIITTGSDGTFEFYVDEADYSHSQQFRIVWAKSGFTSETWDYIKIFPDNDRTLLTDSTVDQGDNSIAGTLAWHINDLSTDPATIRILPGTHIVDTNASIPATISIDPDMGGELQPASGITLTFNNPSQIKALPTQQVFDTTNNSTDPVAFTIGGTICIDWFGAVADDTSIDGSGTNNTNAIVAATASTPTAGGSVLQFSSGGVYDFGTAWALPTQKMITVRGISGGGTDFGATYKRGTVLYFTGSAGTGRGAIEMDASAGASWSGISFENFHLYGGGSDDNIGIYMNRNTHPTFMRNVGVSDFAEDGIKLIRCWNTQFENLYVVDNGGYGIWLDITSNVSFYNCIAKANNCNLYIDESGGIGVFGGEWGFPASNHAIILEGVTGFGIYSIFYEADATSEAAIYIDDNATPTFSRDGVIMGCNISTSDSTQSEVPVQIVNANNISLIGNTIGSPDNSTAAISISATSYNIYENNNTFTSTLTVDAVTKTAGSYGIMRIPETPSTFARTNVIRDILDKHTDTKALWVFDQTSGTTISDRSANGHDLTVAANINTVTSGFHGLAPFVSLDSSTYVDATDHADFTFGDGSLPDSAFSIVWLGAWSANDKQLFAKWDDTTGSELREWKFFLTASAKLNLTLYDESANDSIYKEATAGYSGDQDVPHCYIATYNGTGTAVADITLYRDGTEEAGSGAVGGSYDGMEDLAAQPGSYRTATGGSPTEQTTGDVMLIAVIAAELTAAQVKSLSSLLLGYADNF